MYISVLPTALNPGISVILSSALLNINETMFLWDYKRGKRSI